MTNNESFVDLVEEFDEKKKSLTALRFSDGGQELIKLLQAHHDVILSGLLNTPADQIHSIAEWQGRYKIISVILGRILEDEDAESG